MNLSSLGEIAQSCWFEIPEHFPFVHVDSFVVMPNHVHGILVIDKVGYNSQNGVGMRKTVETQNLASLPIGTKNQFGPQSKNLASVVRGYKVGVTKNARLIHADFGWQSRYHDHIIRNLKSYDKIVNYIQNNPVNWEEDELY